MHSTWTVKQPFGSVFKFFITVFILISVFLAPVTIWVNWALAPYSNEKKERIFVIKKVESALLFSQRLEEEKLIRSSFMFRIYLKLTGLDKKIQAGSYRLSPSISVKEIAISLTKGRLDKWVTIVEGSRKEEIAELLVNSFEINEKKFLNEAVEGELFPDTYLISVVATEDQILAVLNKTFEEKFDKDLQRSAAENKTSKKQVLILASIVEREAKSREGRPVIAGILIKRWKEGMHLATDATIQYALGYSKEEETWWRKNLTEEDLKLDDPYNTRINTGLPPGPICSPGLASIEAVLKPTESDYYFYLHDEEGKVHYGKTFQEHQENIAKYLFN